jgi:hypothetical protein
LFAVETLAEDAPMGARCNMEMSIASYGEVSGRAGLLPIAPTTVESPSDVGL